MSFRVSLRLRRLWWLGWMLSGWLLVGCAAGPQANPADPWEPMNRKVDAFNQVIDKAAIKPLALGYERWVPSAIRLGVRNVLGNFEDAWSMVNNGLQLKPQETIEMGFRVGVNTIFGFGGVLDIASEMEIPRSTEDFGQTLGHYGVQTGPYLVLPILGPSTLRDGTSRLTMDILGDPIRRIPDESARYQMYLLKAVDQRVKYLPADQMLTDVALDPYSFVRDAYLQRRRNLVYDGEPPEEE